MSELIQKEKERIRHRLYYQKHKNHPRYAYSHEYYLEHRDRICAASEKYRKSHKEQINARARARYKLNKEKQNGKFTSSDMSASSQAKKIMKKRSKTLNT